MDIRNFNVMSKIGKRYKTVQFIFRESRTVWLLSCLVLFFSCTRSDDVMCTMEYRSLTVSIRDSASHPVVLTSYFMKKVSTGEFIDLSAQDPYADSINRLQGIYVVGNDGMMGMTTKTGNAFEFHGFMGSQEIVREPYIIGKDECHILLVSGKKVIVLSGK